MATPNPTIHCHPCSSTTDPMSEFEARARADGFLNADGYFVGPPDEFDFAEQEVQADAGR